MLYVHTHTHVHIYMDRFGASIDRHKLEKATAETSVAEVRSCVHASTIECPYRFLKICTASSKRGLVVSSNRTWCGRLNVPMMGFGRRPVGHATLWACVPT